MTQVGLQKQQEGALFPRGAAHDLSPHSMPALMQHRPATQPEQGAQHSSGEAWHIYVLLIGTMWLRHRFNAAAVTQGRRTGSPCSSAALRTIEQNNAELTMCTVVTHDQPAVALRACPYVCVWSDCVFFLVPMWLLLWVTWHLKSVLLNCAQCLGSKKRKRAVDLL